MRVNGPHLPGGLRQRLLDAARHQKAEREQLRGHARLALETVGMFDGRPGEFVEAIADPASWELEAWLSCLPLNLGNVGLVQEAVALGDALTALDPDNTAMYVSDVALVLAEAGRMAEAEARFAAAIQAHPDDEWVRIKAARALMAAGDLEGTERHLRDAVTVSRRAANPFGAADANDELAKFLEQHGRQEEAAAVRQEQEDWRAGRIRTVRRDGPKIGRNHPCPCGSGRKYKRCCGA